MISKKKVDMVFKCISEIDAEIKKLQLRKKELMQGTFGVSDGDCLDTKSLIKTIMKIVHG